MRILLPIFTFLILYLTLLGLPRSQSETGHGLRGTFLQTIAIMGGYIVISSEILSLFTVLTQLWVSVAWLVMLLAIGTLTWSKGYWREGLARLHKQWKWPAKFNLIVSGILVILLTLLFLVAFISPTNNGDSLFYHMSRVVHWAQNGSLDHYATNNIHQVMHPIGSELFILNLRLLWGNDQLANLVQFFCLIGTLISVTAIASLFGLNKSGQWLAAGFAISIPGVLLEATSTQNDVVVGFWFVTLLYLIFHSWRYKPDSLDLACIGLTLGLGLLTKATFYFYAIPPILFIIIHRLVKSFSFKTVLQLILVGVIALLLNLGYWTRNLITFQSPFGQAEYVSNNISQLSNPGLLITGPVKLIAQNFMTPDEGFNASLIVWLNDTFTPIDPSMEYFKLEWGWNHDDLAGNPVHSVLVIVSVITLLVFRKRIPGHSTWLYLVILFGSIYLISIFTNDDLYGVRFQLPFFLAFAPLFGMAVGSLNKKSLTNFLIVLLLLGTLPWILFNRTRPLIAMRDSTDRFTIPCLAGCTTGSILNETPANIIFGSLVEIRESYTSASKVVRESGCREIGLQLDSHDPEYLFWWLLDAPQSGIRIETGTSFPELQQYIVPDYQPCAILCTTCTQTSTIEGYQMEQKFGGVLQDGVLYGGVLYYTKMDDQP